MYRKMNYKDYLKSKHWKDVKKRYRASKYPNECYLCGKKTGLDLHHRSYKRLGNERLSDLIYLCRECHDRVHDRLRNSGSRTNLWNVAKKLKGNKQTDNKKKKKNKKKRPGLTKENEILKKRQEKLRSREHKRFGEGF